MTEQEILDLSKIIIDTVKSLQSNENGWIPFTDIGQLLTSKAVNYKKYDKNLRQFLNHFSDILDFQDILDDKKPPVCYVRLKSSSNTLHTTENRFISPEMSSSKRIPTPSMNLLEWAFIPYNSYSSLDDLALKEKWYYGKEIPSDKYSILKNYLNYTFKRLCHENKICLDDVSAAPEEYAAFNTGLVDKSYRCIYALFKKNSRPESPQSQYWYLVSFVVEGEKAGKTLVSHFNPLPRRADYILNNV